MKTFILSTIVLFGLFLEIEHHLINPCVNTLTVGVRVSATQRHHRDYATTAFQLIDSPEAHQFPHLMRRAGVPKR